MSVIAFDPGGSAYMGGGFEGTADLDPGPGVITGVGSGSANSFVVKLGPTGTTEWAKALSNLGASPAPAPGGVVMVGWSPPGPGPLSAGTFMTKLNADGTTAWTITIASPNAAGDVVADATKFIAFGIQSHGGDFDPGPGTTQLTPPSAFISRYAF